MRGIARAGAVVAGVMMVTSLLGGAQAGADDFDAYERREFQGSDGGSLPYRILFPEGAQEGQRYPLVLFLHGAGERGSDNRKQLIHGGSLFLDPEVRKAYPAIVVFPQCPEDAYWVDLRIRARLYAKEKQDFREVFAPPMPQLVRVFELVEKLIAEQPVDPDRVYIMGLSMGALGTYETLARRPDLFAAAVAICGGGNLEATERYADRVAVWITHGDEDPIVPVEYSRNLYAALSERGAEVKYTEFPGVGHDAWTPTLAMPDLLPWLFSHRRGDSAAPAAEDR